MSSSRKRFSLHDESALELIDLLYPSSLIAADSKLHLLTWDNPDGSQRQFRGLIGSVLYIKKPKDFALWYDHTIQQLTESFGIERTRYVYKSSQIGAEFPGNPDKALFFLNDFVRELCRLDNGILFSVNVLPFTLDIRALKDALEPTDPGAPADSLTNDNESEDILDEEPPLLEQDLIRAYGEEGSRWLSPSTLINKLRDYYPIVCVWKLAQVLNISYEEVLLDGCQGQESKAWRDLLSKCRKLSILYHGDEYSPFISSCDLFVRWVDETLKKSKRWLIRKNIDDILHRWVGVTAEEDTENFHCTSIWNPDLSMIVPISTRTIQRFETHFAKRPITFLVHETDSKKLDDRKAFENSPLHAGLVHDLYKSGGSYLWFNPLDHTKIIHPGSRFLIWGSEGEAITSQLLGLGFRINVIRPANLLSGNEQ